MNLQDWSYFVRDPLFYAVVVVVVVVGRLIYQSPGVSDMILYYFLM